MNLVGYKALELKLQALAKDAPVAAAAGTYKALQLAMITAKDLAPKDTVTMAKSGYVTAPEVTSGGHVSIEAGFGGGSEDYVVRQHEDLSLNHPNGGQAKFFEAALDLNRQRMMETIKEAIIAYMTDGKVRFERLSWEGFPIPQSPWEQAVAENGG